MFNYDAWKLYVPDEPEPIPGYFTVEVWETENGETIFTDTWKGYDDDFSSWKDCVDFEVTEDMDGELTFRPDEDEYPWWD